MHDHSMVRQAEEEFFRGNFQAALGLYRKLSEKIGERFFRTNIWVCERRLNKKGRRDCTRLPLREIKVAAVMDEFTFHCFAPECNLLPLSPANAA